MGIFSQLRPLTLAGRASLALSTLQPGTGHGRSSALSLASFSTQVPSTDQGVLMWTEAEPAQSPGRRWPEACERHAPRAEHAGTCPLTRSCGVWGMGLGASITPPTERHALPRIREALTLGLGPGQKLHALSSSWPACPRSSSSLTLLPDGLSVSSYFSIAGAGSSRETLLRSVWPDPHSLLGLWAKGHMLHFCSQAGKSPAWLLPPLHGPCSGKTLLQENISENSPIFI